MSSPRIIDLRDDLPPLLRVRAATGTPTPSRAVTLGAVLHYNGGAAPARAGGSRSEIVTWLRGVVIPNHIARIGTDGVAYHYYIAHDGSIYQLRDIRATLWHCGGVQNHTHLALHIPIGASQVPSDAQWQATTDLLRYAMHIHQFPRSSVLGHRECGASACPGAIIMDRLVTWRAWDPLEPRMAIVTSADGANIRREPRMGADVLVRVMPPGAQLELTATDVRGQYVGGTNLWYRLTDGMVVHSSVVSLRGR